MSGAPSASVFSRIAEATRLKEEGNAKLTAKDYKGAVGAYKKVFLYTRGLDVSKSELSMYSSSLGKETPTPDQMAQVCAHRSYVFARVPQLCSACTPRAEE